MARQQRLFALVVAVLLATTTQTFAQGRQTGTVRGTTYDAQRLALPGVTITLTSNALQGERVSVSGATGAFEFLGLPPGLYDIQFVLDGFESATDTARVQLGGIVGVNVEMEPGRLAESVQAFRTAARSPLPEERLVGERVEGLSLRAEQDHGPTDQ